LKFVIRCATLAALVPLLACTSFEQRVVAVENRQAAIEQQISELQTGIMETQARLVRVQSDLDEALDPLRTQNADRGEDLRAIRREVTALEQRIADYDARIAELLAAAEAGGNRNGGGTLGSPMPPARGQRTVTDGRTAPPDDAAQTLYTGAYNDYVRDNYELGIQGFEEYLRLFPGGPRAANSRYWIGVCHRQLGRLDDARRAFQQVIADYPSNDLAADAMFNDALILRELGRDDDAAATLNRLIQAYPNRDAAFLACGLLEDLGVAPPAACSQ
jgi:tol-pal system protein YbgF